MTMALLLGGGIGAGLWMITRGLWPPRPSLAEGLAALHRTPEVTMRPPHTHERQPGSLIRFGQPLSAALGGRNFARLVPAQVRGDLVVVGRHLDEHIAEKLATGVLGLLLVPAGLALLLLGGVAVPLPIVAPLPFVVLVAAGFFFMPDLAIRSEAVHGRREMRNALS